MALTQDDVYQAADELRAIASLGLQYSKTEYDRDRYERTLAVGMRLLSKLEGKPIKLSMDEFRRDNWLHISPANGAEAFVFRDDKVLLIRRKDNGLWALPGGLTDVGETLAHCAERELWEETGLRGKADRLLAVFDNRLWNGYIKAHLFGSVFHVIAVDGDPSVSNETLDVAFFSEESLPELDPFHAKTCAITFQAHARRSACAIL
ncbi:MAG: NUDIX domain-containing protein [Anaerolineae bacterium]|nr:NUDIX domain-containing protein [Anaerolineae bacterium]